MEKTKFQRVGKVPIAEMRVVYRDLRTLQHRGIVKKEYMPEWLSAPAGAAAAGAAAVPGTQIRRGWNGLQEQPLHLAFQPGEVVDLTAD